MSDVDQIIRVASAWPDVDIQQLHVLHAGADDDGIWFFTRGQFEVQLESSTGMSPFLIESDEDPKRSTANSIEEAIAMLRMLLHFDTICDGAYEAV